MKKYLIAFLIVVICGITAYAQVALDPSRLSMGARPLGLGRAYVGVSDDMASIFLNPAGLATLQNWQLTSMSGKLLEEFNYIMLAGAFPTKWGIIGLAITGGTAGGAIPTTIEASTAGTNDPVYVADTTGEMSYQNYLTIISYANTFERKGLPKLNLGANFKLFNVGLSGDKIDRGQGTGTGTELDVGLQVKPLDWLNLGVTGQNILPASMGGKITYGSGYSESYPALIKIGTKARALGNDGLIKNVNMPLDVLADLDWQPTVSKAPILFHAGFELRPAPMLVLRGGIEQDTSSDENGNLSTVNNLAGGVGIEYGGFRFDYAYHQFAGAPGIDNHFFSLSYGLLPPAKEEAKPTEIITVYSPADKSFTFTGEALVKGKVNSRNVQTLKVAGKYINFKFLGSFEATVALKQVKNLIKIEAYDMMRKLIETKNIRILKLPAFPDVPQGYWVREPISILALQKIITGYPDGSFKPQGNITRAEMAALLVRTKAVKMVGKPEKIFNDMKREVGSKKVLGIDMPATPEYHILYTVNVTTEP